MDVARIIESYRELLIEEDLLLLEEQLQTGTYDNAYVRRCSDAIMAIRQTKGVGGDANSDSLDATRGLDSYCSADATEEDDSRRGIYVAGNELSPYGAPDGAGGVAKTDPFLELEALRHLSKRKSQLKSYIERNDFFDEEFIDENFSRFDDLELKIIVSSVPLSESFLEKYLGALDPESVARHQSFSEAFFMRHFKDFDYDVVLNHGVNSWRTKEGRSKKLDTFLRLKGVMV